jgi:hypothetical protein
MSSLEAAAYSVEKLRMMEKGKQEIEFVDQDDNEQWRSDLPERFSELLDKHFPLFITYDRVRVSLSLKHSISPLLGQLCTMLQNDIERTNHLTMAQLSPRGMSIGDEATSPTTPTPPQESRLRAGSGILSSFDHTQQVPKNFVSYSVFLASYWDHLPQNFTRVLGEKGWLIPMTCCDGWQPRPRLGVQRIHGSNQGI